MTAYFRESKFFRDFFSDEVMRRSTFLTSSAAGRLSGRMPRSSKGYFLLFWVAILRDQVAGIAGEHEVIHLPLAARAEVNHFVDVNKMVCDGVTGYFTGDFCF